VLTLTRPGCVQRPALPLTLGRRTCQSLGIPRRQALQRMRVCCASSPPQRRVRPFVATMRASISLGCGALPIHVPRRASPRVASRPVAAGGHSVARLAGSPAPGGSARHRRVVLARDTPDGGASTAETAPEVAVSSTPPLSVDILTERVTAATQARQRASKRIAALGAEVRRRAAPNYTVRTHVHRSPKISPGADTDANRPTATRVPHNRAGGVACQSSCDSAGGG